MNATTSDNPKETKTKRITKNRAKLTDYIMKPVSYLSTKLEVNHNNGYLGDRHHKDDEHQK